MKHPRILLIGIGGVYNYGCEAIVRGTETIVRRAYPKANIVYASYRVADDLERLKGSAIQVIERVRPRRYLAKNICRKLLLLVGIRWSPMVEPLRVLKGIDAVFSIGGDIYTLDPNGDYAMAFPKFGEAVQKRGVPYVLWGASIGPFAGNPKVEKFFTKHLRGLRLITAREEATVDYLESLGVRDNVVPCADPAYVVAPEIIASGIRQGGKFTIGINLSPLSVNYGDSSEVEVINAQAKTIEGLIKSFNAHILLIPHVVSDFSEVDDDLRYLRKIKKAVASKHQESLTLLESDPGFVGVKKELIKCDLVIAARMHCAVNALTAHVPTILVAYSRKAVGMCQYVYGSKDWVLPLSEFSTGCVLVEKVRSMMVSDPVIRDYLANRIPVIQQEVYQPLMKLEEVLGHLSDRVT